MVYLITVSVRDRSSLRFSACDNIITYYESVINVNQVTSRTTWRVDEQSKRYKVKICIASWIISFASNLQWQNIPIHHKPNISRGRRNGHECMPTNLHHPEKRLIIKLYPYTLNVSLHKSLGESDRWKVS